MMAALAAGCGTSVISEPASDGDASSAGGTGTSSSASTGGSGGDGVCDVGIDHGCTLWARRFGYASDQYFHGPGIAADPAGDLHLAGELGSGADFGGGLLGGNAANTSFLAKLDAAGEYRNARAIDGSVFPIVVAGGSDGSSVVAGGTNGTIDLGGGPLSAPLNNAFVGKYDPAGDHVWSLLHGGEDFDTGEVVGVDAAGNVYVGVTAIVFDRATSANEFLLKYSPEGRLIWKKKACTYPDCFPLPWAMAVGAGRIVVAGFYSGTPDFGHGPLPEPSADPGMFVATFTLDGAPLWSRGFVGTGIIVGFSVAMSDAGDVFAVAELEGTADFGNGALTSAGGRDIVLARFDPTGVTVWSQRWGGPDSDYTRSVVVDPLGNIVLSADPSGLVDFGGGPIGSEDFAVSGVVAAFDVDGAHVWSRALPFSVRSAVSVPSANEIVFAGSSNVTIDVGTGPLGSAGGSDAIVVALSP